MNKKVLAQKSQCHRKFLASVLKIKYFLEENVF